MELWFYWCTFEFWKKWKLPHVNSLLENKIATKSTASIQRNSFLTQLSAQAGRINRQSLAPRDASLHGPTLQAPVLLEMDSLATTLWTSILSITAVQEASENLWNDAILGIVSLQHWSKNNNHSLIYILYLFQDTDATAICNNVKFWELVYFSSLSMTIPIYAWCVC